MDYTEHLHSELEDPESFGSFMHRKIRILEEAQECELRRYDLYLKTSDLKEENKKLKEQLDEQYEFSHYKQAKEYEKLKADITLHPDFKALVEFAMAEPERQRVAHQEAGTALDYTASSSSVVESSHNKFSNK